MPIRITAVQKVLPVAHRSRCFGLRCRLLRFKIRGRRCDGGGGSAAEGDLLFLLIFVHFLFAHIHGAADGAAGFAQDEPGYETFGMEFMRADGEFEDGFRVGLGGGGRRGGSGSGWASGLGLIG